MSWLNWLKKPDTISLQTGRFIVFDLETTGLNPHTDEPIAIGAVAIENAAIQLGDQFSSHIRSSTRSAAQAALAHRLDYDTLQHAPETEQVLQQFYRYVDGAPCLAYHSAFDDQFLKRAYKKSPLPHRWPRSLDVAHWLLWLHPELGPQPPSLDKALTFARIRQAGRQRHAAPVDAMLTAQLVLSMMPTTQSQDVTDWHGLKTRINIASKLRQARS